MLFGECFHFRLTTFELKSRKRTFTRAFPCNKKIKVEQTVKTLVEQLFKPYGAPKEVHPDEDARIQSDTGWYKRVMDALNIHVTTNAP